MRKVIVEVRFCNIGVPFRWTPWKSPGRQWVKVGWRTNIRCLDVPTEDLVKMWCQYAQFQLAAGRLSIHRWPNHRSFCCWSRTISFREHSWAMTDRPWPWSAEVLDSNCMAQDRIISLETNIPGIQQLVDRVSTVNNLMYTMSRQLRKLTTYCWSAILLQYFRYVDAWSILGPSVIYNTDPIYIFN